MVENSTIPYQLHRKELELILSNAEKFYPFLSKKDESGYTISEKIMKTFEFRIPYYVGLLNDKHSNEKNGFSWIVKKSNDKVMPWNFNEIVDEEKSAEAFITKMTNTCSYLIGEDVLPKNSLLYEEFMVLNEINNIRINGTRINKTLKEYIYEKLFIESYNPNLSIKKLKENLVANNLIKKEDELTGLDIKINSSLKTYHAFKNTIGSKIENYEAIENIIKWATLYNDAKKMLKTNIERNYSNLFTKDEINRISKISIKDWGRLSKTLLEKIVPDEKKNNGLGQISIIQAMRENSLNFMELLSRNYGYSLAIEKFNEKLIDEKTIEDLISESYISPAGKRMVNRSIAIIKEIVKITGKEPKKVFIEMARGEDKEKKRTKSRKNELIEIYKSYKNDEHDWKTELEGYTEDQLRSKKRYLYYTQMGRCMYSGETIDIDRLFDENLYDIDHIYPRSKIMDDSIRNNLVLVKKVWNEKKTDLYPLKEAFGNMRPEVYMLWDTLNSRGLISDEKYKRLKRTEGFTEEELAKFINRQLVETRQSTKEVARILESVFKNTEVVYVKANNVSFFRNLDKVKLIKVREINDLHHAEDAYLNIVVGNAYDTKFTKNPMNFIKNAKKREYNIYKLFDEKIERGSVIAWDPEKTLDTVKNELSKKDIQFTRYAYEKKGAFYDMNPLTKEKAAGGTGYHPLKGGDERYQQFNKYGAYPKISNSYFTLVEHTKKGKIIRSIEAVPNLDKSKLTDKEKLETYLIEKLKLENPKVLIEKIKINSLFKINGFYYHITGKSGDSYVIRSAVQLQVGGSEEKIIKQLINIKNKNFTEESAKEVLKEEQLDKIYFYLLDKYKNTIYKNRINSIGPTLEKNLDKYYKLEFLEKVDLILTVIRSMNAINEIFDLKKVGGSGQAGKMSISKKISNNQEFKLINKSVTGLYESEIDLLGDF